jgi:hypothetical protein
MPNPRAPSHGTVDSIHRRVVLDLAEIICALASVPTATDRISTLAHRRASAACSVDQ